MLSHLLKNRCLVQPSQLAYTLCTRRYEAFSKTGKWDMPHNEFTSETCKAIEAHWKPILLEHDKKCSQQSRATKGKKFYVLSMFPYPSGQLHMGHIRVYTTSDVLARYHRITGKTVLHPMGWDAFGLPAENAAIERGVQPAEWTRSNIEHMKKQLNEMCYSFDWDRELSTCDPAYYKWTQYIFLKMFEANLAYQKQGDVNWDPVDQTVLADEQVSEDGYSWRSGAKVEKRFLKQWYIRSSAYHQSLFEGLSTLDVSKWKDIIALQKGWMGELDGHTVQLLVPGVDNYKLDAITKHCEALMFASHVLVSPEHYLNQPQYYKYSDASSGSEKVIELNITAINPLTGATLPIYVHTDMQFTAHTQTHVAIPTVHEADLHFTVQHGCRIPTVETFPENVVQMTQQTKEQSREDIAEFLKANNNGGHVTSEDRRDWLISRQRYWGTPIPIIHCPKKGPVPVPVEDLPVLLPDIPSLAGSSATCREDMASPLRNAPEEWLHVKCPGCDCGSYGRRETDTMDTFVDSSWYYLRYTDNCNDSDMFSTEAVNAAMPVDLYIGGKEHATLHLYYARFVNHFMHNEGLVEVKEPFDALLTQGMVLRKTYKLGKSDQYLKPSEIAFVEKDGKSTAVHAETGETLKIEWAKMSKSKYNGVDPQAIIDKYGVDATRLCIMHGVTPMAPRKWDESDFLSVIKFKRRVGQLVTKLVESHKTSQKIQEKDMEAMTELDEELMELRDTVVINVNYSFNKTLLISSGLEELYKLSHKLVKYPSQLAAHSSSYEQALAELLIMMSPFTPMFSCECWSGLQHIHTHTQGLFSWDNTVLDQSWPRLSQDALMPVHVRLNDLLVYTVKVPKHQFDKLTSQQAVELAVNSDLYSEHIDEQNGLILDKHVFIVPDYSVTVQFVVKRSKDTNKQKKKKRKKQSKLSMSQKKVLT